MCGICGRVDLKGPLPEDLISRMSAALRHRGPDDEGQLQDAAACPGGSACHVGLGHRRLSIIDLTAAGHQPMSNETSEVWLVFNGEVYNFAGLRQELAGRGHRFRSRTDSEVIVHGYEEWGPAVLERLRGMFALALWDRPRRRLMLARDRLGKKPLFYHFAGSSLTFASEVAALLEDRAIERRPDLAAIHDFLSYQYVPPPGTGLLGVKKLPPAHRLLWEVGAGEPRIEPYWRLIYRPRSIGCEEAQRELVARLTEAVRLRLISDVPLGAFLSGGLDSSILVALMKRLSPGPVKTFAIGFEEGAFDERPHARQVARLLGTEHHEFIVRPDAAALLPVLVRHYGELYSDSSALPTYYLAQMTRQHVTVALSGDAGDENFAGYDRYAAYRLLALARRLPAGSRRILAAAAARVAAGGGWYSSRARLARFLAGAAAPESERAYFGWLCNFSEDEKSALYRPEMAAQCGADSFDYLRRTLDAFQEAGEVGRLMAADLVTYLPHDLLAKVDVASMAHALEVRCPFLDHHLVEFAASLPLELKLRGLTQKWLLKRAFAGVLPRQILQRRKHGFGVPLGAWLRGSLKEFARQVLLDPKSLARGYFRREALEGLLAAHASGAADHGYRLWALLVLELWHRQFIDTAPPQSGFTS